MSKQFLLIDRDGTLIVEKNYLSDPDQVELIEGGPEALSKLSAAGWGIVVVTNQAGIGRGYFKQEDMEAVHAKISSLLAPYGVLIDAYYFCPHHPDERCHCRKPNPGMAEQAAVDFGFDPKRSVMVGDKICDINLGRGVGAKTILVRTGYGHEDEKDPNMHADLVINSLADLNDAIASIDF